jgi:hypothetical protein
MVLSRNIRETLWPVFSCKNLICHKEKSTKKINKRRTGAAAQIPRNTQSHTPLYRPQPSPAFGAEGASASMADRAVRAART